MNDQQQRHPLTDAEIEEKVNELLGRMTIQEKIGQLCQPFGWHMYHGENGKAELTDDFKQAIAKGGIGSLYGTLRADPWTGVTLETGLSPREGVIAINEIQRYAIENSRLGIPILFGEECSHGHMAIGATVFPVPLAIGSTWNIDLYRKMCQAIALETRAQGGAVTYSPVLDVVRDPRWGRTEECFGEDPYMIGEFAVASVEGLQGNSLDREDTVVATLKHFAAYGSSEGGRNAAPVHMGVRELHDIDLYPFKKAVEAGALSIMPAYHEIDGIPCTVNEYLLQDVLRDQWGFDGYVITDCGAIEMLVEGHDVAEDGGQAAAMAIKAGIDMEMSGTMFGKPLLAALERGDLQTSHIDQAVKRVLRIKYKLGLFDHPYVDPQLAERVIGCEEHAELAYQVASEAVVMLKNEANLLPLGREATVAIIGPNADQPYHQLGDYTSPQPSGQVVTVLEGMKIKLGVDKVKYAPGCRITGASRDGFDSALSVATEADVIVMVMGGSSARDFGEGTIDLRTGASIVKGSDHNEMDCGEGIDRSDLTLSGVQLQLLQHIHQLGKPVVVVYINGRPIAEPWVDDHAHAILEAWYPGQAGGLAIADILLGDVNPSGKLTITVPQSVGQLPMTYNAKRSKGKRYLEMDLKPRYPFGYGLSYTQFAYSDLSMSEHEISKEALRSGQSVQIQLKVTNSGLVEGAEVVQLYVTDKVSSVARPGKELKGFHKLFLQPGETKTVTFEIAEAQLGFTDQQLNWNVEQGEFVISVAQHSDDSAALLTKLTVK
ncbi:MAG: glycoside hydrolase family 3 N-terminal domain-containing protein [Candidatus Cohnella colombiensis]|uniref:Glycoside hydrolase family 3 N-terminal domain-containing protein n=1 Tax=Candidatus Cohnella colombiensis TaxID=3121368 RepID=A0AA95JGR1_9BACL|nr:MAG: glycoside hydrolase family 3 N-terminal domain-containing protein [Cohnella sp.]